MRSRLSVVAAVTVTLVLAPAVGSAADSGDQHAKAPNGPLAAIAPTTPPDITSPAEGDPASGVVTVTATSTASVVRFTLVSAGVSVDADVDHTVDPGPVLVTADLPTYGASGLQAITAADCDGVDCGPEASVNVDILNPSPTITAPLNGSIVGTSFVAAADAAGGPVGYFFAGLAPAVVQTEPYRKVIDTTGIGAGPRVLKAAICNESGDICDTDHPSQSVSVTVKIGLLPNVSTVRPSRFSPGQDGRKDTTTVSYTLDVAQAVTWSVLTTGGAILAGPTDLGTQLAGGHSFVFNGRKTNGALLRSGSYVIRLDTTRPANPSPLTGQTEALVVVDRTAPRGSRLRASPKTFYPAKDRYKDVTKLSTWVSEPVHRITVQVRNAKGKVVSKAVSRHVAAGAFHYHWNGRRHGSLLAAGRYRFRFVMRDLSGNTASTPYKHVKLSRKKLVGR